MTRDITITNSHGVTIAINDIAAYEAQVAQRVEERTAQLQALLASETKATEAQRQTIVLLQQQIDTDRARLRDLDTAFAEYRDKIAELERLLTQATGATADIGANRIADAKAALEAGDATKADEIFAEVEALEANAVRRAADAAFGRGLIAEEQVRWRDAADHYAKAARLNPSYDTLIKAGTFHWRAGQHGAAIAAEQALLALSRAEFGPDSPKTAIAMNNLASSYRAMGRYAEAEPLYRQAIDIGAKTLGEGHPDYATRLNNLAGLLEETGRYAEAEPLYRQAIDIGAKTLGEGHPDYATRLNNLAGLLEETGRYAEAEPLYRQAMEITRKTLGEGHPDYAIHLNNLALLLWSMGRYAEAEPLYRQAMEIDRKALGEGHPDYATDLNNLALLLWKTNRQAEAVEMMARAQQIATAALGADHPNTKRAAQSLAGMRAEWPDGQAW